MRAGAVVALLVLAAVAGATGCSSDSAPPTETIAAPDEAFCAAFGDLVDGPLSEGELDTSDPELLRAAVQETQDTVGRLRASAPPAIAQEVGEVADAFDAMFAVVARYGYDLGRLNDEATPQEQATFDAVGQSPSGPDAADPYQALTDYFGDRCSAGVTIPDDLVPTSQA